MQPYYEIVPLNRLVPLEQVFQHHLENLSIKIKKDNHIKKPIIADMNTGLILDGSNRYAFLLKEGFLDAPVFWCDYSSYEISSGISLPKEFLVDLACVKKLLLPPRTTRHKFPFLKNDWHVHLHSLRKNTNNKSDISHLLYLSTKKEEIAHNIEFIKELDDTKSYLLSQLNALKPRGIFVGKFNPPHIGHIKTIYKLKERFHLDVVVTCDTSDEYPLSPSQIGKEFQELGIDVSILTSKLVDLDKNPFHETDIVLSGNPEVIKWCQKLNVTHEFVERSGLVSGEILRRKYKNKN